STINNFSNKGTISSNNGEAIYLGNTEITTFTNSGTISSANKQGINIASGATIETFNNSGTISSNSGQGINIASSATITNFTNDSNGLIQGNKDIGALNIESATIKTLTNKGTIKNIGNTEPAVSFYVSSGIALSKGTIDSFTNDSNGLISGIIGIKLAESTIENFTNKGTIESTSNNNLAAGIKLSTALDRTTTITNFTNEGTIQSNSNGILVEAGNKIGTLTNSGTIEASLNGISFYGHGDVSGNTTNIGKITIESGGVIKAGNDAIHIDGSDRDIEGEGIDVKGRLEGGNAGIY
ncbi:autotransporter outer membrane beta-barrel domain-containing protein, partial [Campylobacter sp. TTU-622]|nr:autotransporter outer membrane beta-barrel domain-containing protein [Campylobacter sp. TTU-622]